MKHLKLALLVFSIALGMTGTVQGASVFEEVEPAEMEESVFDEDIFDEILQTVFEEEGEDVAAVFDEIFEDVETTEDVFAATTNKEYLLSLVPKYYSVYFKEQSYAQLDAVVKEISAKSVVNNSQVAGYEARIQKAVERLEYKNAEVPRIFISTENGNGNTIRKEDGYVPAEIAIVESNGETIYCADAEIKVRGNSTARAPKRPYKIKLSSKENVLGMGKAKKWNLLANCFDPTLMRNYIGLELASQMGLDFSCEKAYVEIFVDGSFRGNYLLTEPVEVGGKRVDIDLTAGEFLVELEATRQEDETYVTLNNGLRFVVSEPEEPSQEQAEYILSVLNHVADVVSTGKEEEISQVLDVESFTKFYVINEFMKNQDFAFTSVFFYWKGGKLYAGPAWDFDLSAGNGIRHEACSPTDGIWCDSNWYKTLLNYGWFKRNVKKVYYEYLPLFTSIYEKDGMMDQIITTFGTSFARNYTEAPWDVSKSYFSSTQRKPDSTYEGNVAFLRQWYAERCKWLQDAWEIGYGWDNDDFGRFFLLMNGERAKGFLKYKEKTYYFDKNGYLQVGWINVGGSCYYADPEKSFLSTSWKEIDGFWYCFAEENGKMLTGMQRIGNCSYYFEPETGHMLTGWQTIGLNVYYFNENGQRLSGLRTIDGETYYFNPGNGKRKSSWIQVDGAWYYFDRENSCVAVSGMVKIGNCTYYFDPKTKQMQTGWVRIGDPVYYFNASGKMVTGLNNIDGKIYCFREETGVMRYGWKLINDKWYFFDPAKKGAAVTGTCRIGSKKYTFNDAGELIE